MKKTLSLLFALTGWFAIITQYVLMIRNSEFSFWETTIRFFSYFTILTNIVVAFYFTVQTFKKSSNEKSGILTAITVYISIVGLIYQFLLRSTWNPSGMQKLVDELLHSVIPLLVLIYWYWYEKKNNLKYGFILKWAIYPVLYLGYILIRGSFSGFYPYPFVDVASFGLTNVLINALWITAFFFILSLVFIKIGKLTGKS